MTAQLPIVTALYAGLLGLVALVLAGLVIRLRGSKKVGLGDGGDPELMRAIRVQGNFSEYVPLILVLMAIAEIVGEPRWLIHALGFGLLVGRLLHAYGLQSHAGTSSGRFVGTVLTFLALGIASLALVIHAIGGGVF